MSGSSSTDRRDLLRWLGRGLGGLFLAGAAALGVGFARAPRARDLSRRLPLGPAGELGPGAALYLPEVDVHVLQGTRGIYALSGRCTHLGCSLKLEPDGFACPCHGAHFDRRGQPVSGPAPQPLTGYRVSVDQAGQAWLHLDERVPAGTGG